MKKRIFLMLLAVVFLLGKGNLVAFEKAKAEIATLKKQDAIVYFKITANKPFITGGNVYVLHIGNQLFAHSKQAKEQGKGSITFFIPIADFNKLTDGATIYLTYGNNTHADDLKLENLSKQEYYPCWFLGQFDHSLLDK